jgi:hypothetical protein
MRLVFLLFVIVCALPGPAAAAMPQVRATPERVLLGQDTTVELRVQVPEETGPVRAAASTGSFAQEVVEDGGERVFRWTPPDIKYPLAAILVFWVEVPQGPPELTVVRIPLVGRTTLPITTDPGAEVVIEISQARFGPVKADRRGRAQVPVEVPPGVTTARVLATRGELKTDRVVPIEVPVHRPLVAVLSPDPLPRSGGWLVVAGEESLKAGELELSSQEARLEAREGPLVRYRVSPQAGASSVSVEVRRKKAKDTARAQAAVSSQVEAPATTVVTPPPSSPSEKGVLALHLLAGGFFAGGANRGPAVALGTSFAFWNGRLAAELEVGLRRAAMDAQIEGFGTLHSRVLAGPVLASARVRILEHSAFALYGRVGGGVLPFQHEISSDFQAGFGESKLGSMAFVAAQGAWRLGRLSVLMELRGEYSPVRTPSLDAQLGGAGASLGVRYEP